MLQEPQYAPEEQYEDWYEEQAPEDFQQPSPEETGSFPIPVSATRTREPGEGGGPPEPNPTEEDYYQVFRKSIDGSYPTAAQFRDDVEATFGISVPPRDADRMVNRFAKRHTAELQEDHIA
jgi:hypothetical protein